MANPKASDILGRITLVTGPEEFLNQRTVSAALAAVRAADPESEVSETNADQMTMASLGDLAAPSLFSSVRCVVVRGLENLPDDVHDGLLDYAAAPVEDVGLVLVHSGGQKGSRAAQQAPQGQDRHRGEVGEPEAVGVRPVRRVRGARTAAAGSATTPPQLLVQAVGQDLRALAGGGPPADERLPGRHRSPRSWCSATSAAGPR